MKKSTIPYSVLQLKKMYETTKLLDFDCPIQRRYGSWDLYKKSLLPHSMLVGFVIPPIYMTKEHKGAVNAKGKPAANYSCIDGQHRLISLFDYINDEYPLHEDTPDVDLDDGTYEVAGLKFSELPEEIKQMILSYSFTIYNLEECTDEEIEEMFFRLNNGSGLSKTQIANVKLGMKMAAFVKEILGRKFFNDICYFTPAQYRRAADEKTLLQAMMILDYKDENYNLSSISEGNVTKYAEMLHDDDKSDEKCNRILEIVDYMETAFNKQEKFMKVVNIPIFMYIATKAIENRISAEDFYKWFEQFAEKYNPDCEYAQYCSTGSIKKEKVNGRILVMEKDFDEYFVNSESEEREAQEVEETEEYEVKKSITDEIMEDMNNSDKDEEDYLPFV